MLFKLNNAPLKLLYITVDLYCNKFFFQQSTAHKGTCLIKIVYLEAFLTKARHTLSLNVPIPPQTPPTKNVTENIVLSLKS